MLVAASAALAALVLALAARRQNARIARHISRVAGVEFASQLRVQNRLHRYLHV